MNMSALLAKRSVIWINKEIVWLNQSRKNGTSVSSTTIECAIKIHLSCWPSSLKTCSLHLQCWLRMTFSSPLSQIRSRSLSVGDDVHPKARTLLQRAGFSPMSNKTKQNNQVSPLRIKTRASGTWKSSQVLSLCQVSPASKISRICSSLMTWVTPNIKEVTLFTRTTSTHFHKRSS